MARIALVTGGMGGLGEAICIKLAALGYKVTTTFSPSNTNANEWLASMERQGFNFRAYPCDIADYDSAQRCIAQIQKGVGRIAACDCTGKIGDQPGQRRISTDEQYGFSGGRCTRSKLEYGRQPNCPKSSSQARLTLS